MGAATRRPFNIFVYGATKAGKTYAAWQLAKRLCDVAGAGYDKILFVDTEAGRAAYIVDSFPELAVASTVQWEPPFLVPALTRLIQEQQRNFHVIVVDSLSAFYSREGGTLAQVEIETKAQKGNSYTAWNRPGREYNDLLTALTQARCHIIVAARAKMQYELAKDDKGRSKPERVGVGPIVRAAETAFEFDLECELEGDPRIAIIRGSRVNAIPTGATHKGGVDVEWVDAFLGEQVNRHVPVESVADVAAQTVATEDFTRRWKALYGDEAGAKLAEATKQPWAELKRDGAALHRLITDAEQAAVNDAAEREAALARELAEIAAQSEAGEGLVE
jgi:hypothetical protein